jgi:hypothetical protein
VIFKEELLKTLLDRNVSHINSEERVVSRNGITESLTPWSFMFSDEILELVVVSRGKTPALTYKIAEHGFVKEPVTNIFIGKGNGDQAGSRFIEYSRSMTRLSNDLTQRIIEKVGESTSISSKDLYQAFSNELIEYKIDSPQRLRKYLRVFHSDILDFSSTNQAFTLRKQKTDWYELIIGFIREKGEPISIGETKSVHPDISDMILRGLKAKKKDIVPWGNGKLFLKSLIKISRSEKTVIWSFVQEEKVIRTSKLLYFIIEKFSHIPIDNHLINEESLIHFLRIVYTDMFDYKQRGTMIYFLE